MPEGRKRILYRVTNGWGFGLVVIPDKETAIYLGNRVLCWKKAGQNP